MARQQGMKIPEKSCRHVKGNEMSIRRLAVGLRLAVLCLGLLVGESARSADPDPSLTPNAHFMSGKLYMNQKVFDKAEREFAAAVEGDTTNAEYRTFWATSLSQVATIQLDATASITDPEARRAAIRAVAPMLAEASRQFDLAAGMDPKKQAAAADDNRQHYWVDIYKQGLALAELKQYEDAREVFLLTTVIDPKDPSGVFQVAYANRQMGNTVEAVAEAKKAKEMAQIRIAELGDCSQFKSADRKKQCRIKIENMNKIIGNVDSFTRSNNVKLAEEALKRSDHAADPAGKRAAYAEAIGYFEAALDQDPSLNGVRFDLANTHFITAESFQEEKNKAAATESFVKAAVIFQMLADADSVDAETKSLALYNGASALYSAEDFVKAGPLFERYIDLAPREVPAWRLAGICHLEQGRRPEAVSYLSMGSALSEQALVTPVEESVGTIRNLHAGSPAAKALADLGNPEEVKTFVDKDNGNRVVTTWIWWSKGIARHYLNGDEAGHVAFQANTP